MPKAARRQSGPRTEPYPTSKTSTPKSSKKTPPTTKEKQSSTKKALAEKSSSDINASSASQPASFLAIELDDEDADGNIPVYDTCSTIRQKINALLGKDNHKEENGNPDDLKKDGTKKRFTKASFVRAIGGGSTKSLDLFLSKRKIMAGAESPIYVPAYKFFERKRIHEGKPKNKTRQEIENE